MHPRITYCAACIAVGTCVLLVVRITDRSTSFATSAGSSDDTSVIFNIESQKPLSKTIFAWNTNSPVTRTAIPSTSPSPRRLVSFFSAIKNWFRNNFSFISPPPSLPTQTGTNIPEKGNASSPLHRGYHVEIIEGTKVAYHNPFSVRDLRGVALLLHGCSQSAEDWFQLPEHRRIATNLLRQHLALLAITSENRVSGCWSTRFPGEENVDVERVTHIIHQWLRNNGIPSETELYGVGISSGATMLSVLSGTNRTRIVSQALYISLGNPRALRNASENYPNTLFVHLVDDDHYASKNAVAASRKILLSKHVSVVGELPLRPARLSPMTLHEREPRISAESSKRMFSVAAAYDSDIERALRESADETVSGLQAHSALRNSISQIERVMRGAHEVSSSHSNLVAEWLVEHGKKAAR